jgi:hypothetical protein
MSISYRKVPDRRNGRGVRSLIALTVMALAGCASPSQTAPKVTIHAPSQFQDSLAHKQIKKGTLLDEFTKTRAPDSYAVVSARWTDPNFRSYTVEGTYYGATKYRGWHIEVHRGVNPKILRAWESAKDGYDADLGQTIDASARIYPRFKRMRYPWGFGMTYLVQYQNDNTNYVPNNGMLEYELVGFTKDRQYTIRADFGVTHPKLTEFGPKVRDYNDYTFKNDSKMRQDPDYILVGKCPASEFQPSLDDIEAMLDTISVRQ